MRPITDAEMLSASVLSSGRLFLHFFGASEMTSVQAFSSETKFDVNVRQKERLLRKALVAYIGSASEFTGSCSHSKHTSN